MHFHAAAGNENYACADNEDRTDHVEDGCAHAAGLWKLLACLVDDNLCRADHDIIICDRHGCFICITLSICNISVIVKKFQVL